jgi:hypothetical protein
MRIIRSILMSYSKRAISFDPGFGEGRRNREEKAINYFKTGTQKVSQHEILETLITETIPATDVLVVGRSNRDSIDCSVSCGQLLSYGLGMVHLPI